MAGIALKGQCNLVSIMVPPGAQFKRKKKEKFLTNEIKIFMEHRILTILEIKTLILLLLVVFRSLIINIEFGDFWRLSLRIWRFLKNWSLILCLKM